MLDAKELQRHHLNRLAYFYSFAQFLYGSGVKKSGSWPQRRAKKWFCKRQAETISQMPEAVQAYFLPEADEKVLFDFLAFCYEENSRRMAEYFEEQDRILKPLGDKVVRIVRDIQDQWDEDGESAGLFLEKDHVVILAVNDSAIIRRLILEDGILSPEVAERGYLMNIDEVKRENGWYIFYEEEDFVQREVLRFTMAQVQVQCVDCTKNSYNYSDTWMHLRGCASAILRKSGLPGDYCNEQEKTLIPLLREITQFGTLEGYPLLTAVAEETVCRTPYFDKRLAKAQGKARASWNSGLNRAEYEPFLRAIYDKICQSQQGYPSQTDLYCDPQMLAETRSTISEFFYSQGFAGTYPDFYKTADIPGYRIAPGQHGNVLYWQVKNAQMFIRCEEHCTELGELWVHFNCGRSLTGKRPPVQDLFSCSCQDRGYRWSGVVWNHAFDRMLEGAAMAVKRVQLEKLTKAERKRYGNHHGGMDQGSRVAMAVAALALPVTLLLAMIMMVIYGEWEALEKMITEFPLWEILAVYAVIYGLPFGIFALVARRR